MKEKKLTGKGDIAGIVLVASGILLLLWLTWVPSRGVVGNAVTYTLEYLFGAVSVIFSGILVIVGIFSILKVVIARFWYKLAGIVIIVCMICSFADITASGGATRISGVVGDFLGWAFEELFGRTGGIVIIGVGFISGILITFETNVIRLLRLIFLPFAKLGCVVILLVKKIFTGRKFPEEKKEKKEKPPKVSPVPAQARRHEPEEKETSAAADESAAAGVYRLPSAEMLLKSPPSQKEDYDTASLEKALLAFGIKVEIVKVITGPCVIRFELALESGQKISRIQSISNDIAMQLRAESVRILAPIPGKAAVGIEVPRSHRAQIFLREIIESDIFAGSSAQLPVILGENVVGDSIVADLGSMPHLLIAGATGSGKSVCIHNIILSMLFKFHPEDLKLLLVDAKMVELTVYNGCPHLISRVQTDVTGAVSALKWVVLEMERRLKLFSQAGVRDISGFLERGEKLPYIVVIIDELADLMNVAQKDMELVITRLSQMSRAAGIHLILSTQRPSVNVITGVIKANLPARISFKVISKIDSRTILDSQGGETLLGKGDMLYLQPGSSFLERIQSPFVSRKEVKKIADFIKEQNFPYEYLDLAKEVKQRASASTQISDGLFWEAAEFVVSQGKASTSLLQRRFHIGYSRAASLMDTMYEIGIIGEDMGPTKGREILVDPELLEKLKTEL
ncbi:MAG: DNA translocase FtsK 4TM domain-containing protein [bacterium]